MSSYTRQQFEVFTENKYKMIRICDKYTLYERILRTAGGYIGHTYKASILYSLSCTLLLSLLCVSYL